MDQCLCGLHSKEFSDMSYVVWSAKSLATNLAYVNIHSHISIEPGPKVPDTFERFYDGVPNGNIDSIDVFFKLLTGANN